MDDRMLHLTPRHVPATGLKHQQPLPAQHRNIFTRNHADAAACHCGSTVREILRANLR